MLTDGWYKGFLQFGDKFDICMNPIINTNGERFRDWVLWDLPVSGMSKKEKLLPYDLIHLSRWMYISGSYWVAKRKVMEKFPIDEDLGHGEGEDIVWSYQVRDHYDFTINKESKVMLLPSNGKGWKDGIKDPGFTEINEDITRKLREVQGPRRLNNCFSSGFITAYPQLNKFLQK